MKPHLGAHLCRCTGYVKILDAIEAVAVRQAVRPAAGGHGRRRRRQVRGVAARARRPRLHRRHPRAGHAPRRAAAHRPRPRRHHGDRHDGGARRRWCGRPCSPAADIPGELRVGLIHKDWPIMIPVGGRTSCAGDVLAIVVAETREQARAAVGLVEVGYDVLEPVTDPVAALADGSPLACGAPSRTRSRSAPTRVASRSTSCWRRAPSRVHETFRTQRIEHAFLEPESTLAVPSGDGRRRARCTSTPAGRACGTTATTSPPCSASSATGSRSSWSPTAAPSAARRTWPTRPRRRSRRGCSTGR